MQLSEYHWNNVFSFKLHIYKFKGQFWGKKCPPEYDYSIQLRMIAVHVNENLWDIDIQWLFFFL